MAEHLSADLLWELTDATLLEGWNSFQLKHRTGGGGVFSRDPLNLINIQTRKHTGFINDKAIGVSPGAKGGVTVSTKKHNKSHLPGSQVHSATHNKGPRQIYASIVNGTTKRGYRADLRQSAVARASAIKYSQRPKKDRPISKPRGAKAKQAKADQ